MPFVYLCKSCIVVFSISRPVCVLLGGTIIFGIVLQFFLVGKIGILSVNAIYASYMCYMCIHNAIYAKEHNLCSFNGQPSVRLGWVTLNANFALTMPFVQYENAIYAANANCADHTMPFVHIMPIVRTMPFVQAS